MRSLPPVLPPAALPALLGGAAPAPRQDSPRRAAARLRAAVAAEDARAADTRAGVPGAEARLATLEARLGKRRQQLDDPQTALVAARVRLTRLERKQTAAETLLAENLRQSYMD